MIQPVRDESGWADEAAIARGAPNAWSPPRDEASSPPREAGVEPILRRAWAVLAVASVGLRRRASDLSMLFVAYPAIADDSWRRPTLPPSGWSPSTHRPAAAVPSGRLADRPAVAACSSPASRSSASAPFAPGLAPPLAICSPAGPGRGAGARPPASMGVLLSKFPASRTRHRHRHVGRVGGVATVAGPPSAPPCLRPGLALGAARQRPPGGGGFFVGGARVFRESRVSPTPASDLVGLGCSRSRSPGWLCYSPRARARVGRPGRGGRRRGRRVIAGPVLVRRSARHADPVRLDPTPADPLPNRQTWWPSLPGGVRRAFFGLVLFRHRGGRAAPRSGRPHPPRGITAATASRRWGKLADRRPPAMVPGALASAAGSPYAGSTSRRRAGHVCGVTFALVPAAPHAVSPFQSGAVHGERQVRRRRGDDLRPTAGLLAPPGVAVAVVPGRRATTGVTPGVRRPVWALAGPCAGVGGGPVAGRTRAVAAGRPCRRRSPNPAPHGDFNETRSSHGRRTPPAEGGWGDPRQRQPGHRGRVTALPGRLRGRPRPGHRGAPAFDETGWATDGTCGAGCIRQGCTSPPTTSGRPAMTVAEVGHAGGALTRTAA